MGYLVNVKYWIEDLEAMHKVFHMPVSVRIDAKVGRKKN